MKSLHTPKVQLKAESPKKTKLAQVMEARVATNISGTKENTGL
jgi:hypothetical protein